MGYFWLGLRSINVSVQLRLHLKNCIQLGSFGFSKDEHIWMFRGTEGIFLTGDLQRLSFAKQALTENMFLFYK